MDNGVAVLHLAEIQPSELRPLDEVKGDIQKQLLEARSLQSAQIAAQLAGKALQANVAKGGDFKTLAASMKFKVETPPAFVPNAVQGGDPKLQALAYQAIGLEANQVSEPFRLQGGDTFAVMHLDSRGQPDPAGLADFEKRLRGEEDQQLRAFATADWVDWKSKQPGTHKPPDLDAYGTVE
jgi:hypothetical protein